MNFLLYVATLICSWRLPRDALEATGPDGATFRELKSRCMDVTSQKTTLAGQQVRKNGTTGGRPIAHPSKPAPRACMHCKTSKHPREHSRHKSDFEHPLVCLLPALLSNVVLLPSCMHSLALNDSIERPR